MQELSAQHRQITVATESLRKIADPFKAFVHDPQSINSLIESLASAAKSRQHDTKATTNSTLAEAARGYAVLRVQHDCQTAVAAVAAFSKLLQKSCGVVQHDQRQRNMSMGTSNGPVMTQRGAAWCASGQPRTQKPSHTASETLITEADDTHCSISTDMAPAEGRQARATSAQHLAGVRAATALAAMCSDRGSGKGGAPQVRARSHSHTEAVECHPRSRRGSATSAAAVSPDAATR